MNEVLSAVLGWVEGNPIFSALIVGLVCVCLRWFLSKRKWFAVALIAGIFVFLALL